MKDLRVTQAQLLLKVVSYTPVRNFMPLSVVVVGEKFDTADKVYYNNVEVTAFAIISPTQLVVRVPDSEVGHDLTSLNVMASVGTATNAALSFKLGPPVRPVSGVERMVQSYCIVLLSTQGSDVWSPGSGGGVLGMVGRNTSEGGRGVMADLAVAIDNSRQELLRQQSIDQRIPPEERLLSASLQNMSFDPSSSTLTASVALMNSVGQTAVVTVNG